MRPHKAVSRSLACLEADVHKRQQRSEATIVAEQQIGWPCNYGSQPSASVLAAWTAQ